MKGRVLVVDDDPMVRLAVDRQLDALGWDGLVVNTGAEAIRMVEMGLTPQVLLADLRLPDLDACAVAWSISRIAPAVRILFMGDVTPRRALEPPEAPFLSKPFSTPALADGLMAAKRFPRR